MAVTEPLTFGICEPTTRYEERLAAYIVVLRSDRVAMVKGTDKYFLPGGGSLPNESPEDTVRREVREELNRNVRYFRPFAKATQYFCSASDSRNYRMSAVFFVGEFEQPETDEPGEHELEWLPIAEAADICFHECHVWAIRRAFGTAGN